MLLSDFPREIIEQLADSLSLEDKRSCYLVCKSWKELFQDSIHSDLAVCERLLEDLVNPSQDYQPPYLETRLLVRNMTIDYRKSIEDKEIYLLQRTFPNIKYLHFSTTKTVPDSFGVDADWSIWRMLTELHISFDQRTVPDLENKLVKIVVSLPVLRRLEISSRSWGHILSFSLDDFETIHSHLNHLGYWEFSSNLLALSETDLKSMTNVSPATNMGSLSITSENTDHRWLCYFAHKYPNLHTLNLQMTDFLPETNEQRSDTIKLFQQVPLPFQHLTKLEIGYRRWTGRDPLLFWDIMHFHNMPLKHISVYIYGLYTTYHADNPCDVAKNIVKHCFPCFFKNIESFSLKCLNTHSTPIDLTEIKYRLCNLVKLAIETPTLFEIDTLLCAAPRLKSLELQHTDIKVKDKLYNSQRFELQSFRVNDAKITSDVLRFLSFHCKSLSVLELKFSSVYGNFTTPGCQFIDMTYTRFEKFYLERISFIIRDNNKCPDNRNITIITRPIEDYAPKQDYDPNVLPVVVGSLPVKAYYEGFYDNGPHCMRALSTEQRSRIQKFVSNYVENKRITFKRVHDAKRKKPFAKDTLNFEGGKWAKSGAINQIFVKDLKKYTMDAHKIVQDKYKDGDKLRITGKVASEIFFDLRHISTRGGSATDTADLEDIIQKVRRLAVYAFASGKALDENAKDISIRAIKLPTRARYLKYEEDKDKDMVFDQEWVDKIQQARYEESVLQSAVSNNRGRYSKGGYSNRGQQGRGRGCEGKFYSPNTQHYTPANNTPARQHTIQATHHPGNTPSKQHTIQATHHPGNNNDISSNPPGERLNKFIITWKNTINQQWPIMVVKQGYRIQWTKFPIPWRVKPLSLPPEDQKEVDLAVEKIKNSDVIVILPTQNGDYLSQFFIVRETNKCRPILDCKRINQFIQCHHFKMEGVPALRDITEPGDLMTKMDLKDAYIVVPIHKDS
ncbi:hypothetical protein CLU79DRAFT_834859 [Phycomyces nitens]|nr:hypothetical protein CLU79DRAFT_834859 [Phycomyces nitens]